MKLSLLTVIAGAVAGLMLVGAPLEASAQSVRGASRPDRGITRDGELARTDRAERAREEAATTVEMEQADIDAAVRAVIARDGLTCDYETARYLGVSGETSNLYEVGCRAAPGFLLLDAQPATVINCLANDVSVAARRAADPEAAAGAECTLPGNANAVTALSAYAQAAGINCGIDQARWVGQTTSGRQRYEVGCPGSEGAWFEVDQAGTVGTIFPCLQVTSNGGACEFSPMAESAAWLASLPAGEGRSCSSDNARFVGATADGSRYYEVACTDGSGFMVRTNGSREYQSFVPCAEAAGLAGGCRLTGATASDSAG